MIDGKPIITAFSQNTQAGHLLHRQILSLLVHGITLPIV